MKGARELVDNAGGIRVARSPPMLKLVGSYVLARLLGFGIVGAIVIYLLLTMLT